MRIAEDGGGLLDICRRDIANSFAAELLDGPQGSADETALRAASRGVLGGWHAVEACEAASDRDDHDAFSVAFERLRAIVRSASPLWSVAASAFAAASRHAGCGHGGLAFASLHHLLWSEVRAFHVMVAVIACEDDFRAGVDPLEPSADLVRAAWPAIRRAMAAADAVDAGPTEARLAAELEAAIASPPDNPIRSTMETVTSHGTKDAVVAFLRAHHVSSAIALSAAAIAKQARASRPTVTRALQRVFGDGGHASYVAACESGVAAERLAVADGDGTAFGVADPQRIDGLG